MRTIALFTGTPKTAQHLRLHVCCNRGSRGDNQGRAPWLPRAGRYSAAAIANNRMRSSVAWRASRLAYGLRLHLKRADVI